MVDKKLLEKAEEILKLSDKEILGVALGNNPYWAENLDTLMQIKLKNSTLSLNKNIKKLKTSTKWSSWIMGIMTFFILVLTGVIVWKGFWA